MTRPRLAVDISGTFTDIEDGEPRTSRVFEVGRAKRFTEGSGLPVTRVRPRCRTGPT